jgi:transcriptional regulator with XRE-family HTH domain
MQVFAENLKNYLAERKLTQKEVATEINVSTGVFCDWVNARAYPRMDKLQKLADYFGVEKSDLVEKHSLDNKYYVSGQATQIAKELVNNPQLILIYQSFKKLSPDKEAVILSLLEIL